MVMISTLTIIIRTCTAIATIAPMATSGVPGTAVRDDQLRAGAAGRAWIPKRSLVLRGFR